MKYAAILILMASVMLNACTNDHFITDKAYRQKVEKQFEKRKELAAARSEQLFGVFKQKLPTHEEEALKFLYAYCSLSDLADYNGEFFLANVRASFAARDTFSWGKTVPENLFRHFVLPVRVNNENLDSSRIVFFGELKDRVKKLSMHDAVLEVNHWCHEKVTYRGSDSRTSSPLASVRTAWGRCGEESTFTVAALRSVGIPARQCYTPRWAHCDDNHAWVEVWVDGKWHFIGACEPESDLDMAWFAKPAKRAMLVNTTVFGDYEGPEDVLQRDPLFTRINVLANYAEVKKVAARVTDKEGKPVDSAAVEFQLYNYSEFYPLYRTYTDHQGLCTFTTGYGDLVVWAAKGGAYGFSKLDVRTMDTVEIKLSLTAADTLSEQLDLVPPAEKELTAAADTMAAKTNSKRLAYEDGVRSAYESTFIDSARSVRLAGVVGLNADTLWRYLHSSCGNWQTLSTFVTQVPTGQHQWIFPLLSGMSEKDLRDIDTASLFDNLSVAESYPEAVRKSPYFAEYVLSPRIDNEMIRPFRKYFMSVFGKSAATLTPDSVAARLRGAIRANSTDNYGRAPLSPVGAWELGVADPHSADICFVAICRSLGIPARLDPATRVPQCLTGDRWQDIYIFGDKPKAESKGRITMQNPPANGKVPEYVIHYTLESFKDGFFRTLDYEGSPLVAKFPCTVDVPAGPCMLLTGNRLGDGSVLCNLGIFGTEPGKEITREVILRKKEISSSACGHLDPVKAGGINDGGLILAWIDPDKEPTKHLLAEIKNRTADFSNWKGRMVFIVPDAAQVKIFKEKAMQGLPSHAQCIPAAGFGVKFSDPGLKSGSLKHFPVVAFVKKDGTVDFCSEGYRIGLGNELAERASAR